MDNFDDEQAELADLVQHLISTMKATQAHVKHLEKYMREEGLLDDDEEEEVD